MKKLLFTVLGVSALFAAMCLNGCSTEPKGDEGRITVSDTLPVGTASVDTITLKDADLTADTQSVKVTSGVDNTGIYLVLSGKNGIYKGVLSFSTAASTPNSTILVNQNGTVTVTYKDAKPAGTRTEILIWKAGTLGVALDKSSYQGVSTPMIITVTDTNVASQTVSVNVSTTTFTTPVQVILAMDATKYGVYTGSVYFTVGNTATIKDTIRVKDQDNVTVSYSCALIPGLAAATASAKWAALASSVAPGAATYTGLANKMVINVTDSNVTTPTVTVHLKSQKDPTGIDVVLNGSAGSYTGQVGVSLTQSSGPNSVIAVQAPADTMAVSYTDPAVANPVLGAVVWAAGSVTIALDSAAYHGTAEQMAISLTNDHTTAASLVVNVSSTKAGDTIPITLNAVTATPWVFTGAAGFSLGAKTATAVGVKDSDVVTVSYADPVLNETKSASANWFSTQVPAFGITGAGYTSATALNPNLILQLIPWTGGGVATCTIDNTDSLGEDGKTPAVAITAGTVGWAGFGWAAVASAGSGTLASIDMTTYAACTLHVSAKSTTATDFSMLVENLNKTGQTWVTASSVGFVADGNWHDLAIPLSAWSATCDLSNVDYFLGVSMAPYVAGETLVLDNVYWTLPQ